jgi:transposase
VPYEKKVSIVRDYSCNSGPKLYSGGEFNDCKSYLPAALCQACLNKVRSRISATESTQEQVQISVTVSMQAQVHFSETVQRRVRVQEVEGVGAALVSPCT